MERQAGERRTHISGRQLLSLQVGIRLLLAQKSIDNNEETRASTARMPLAHKASYLSCCVVYRDVARCTIYLDILRVHIANCWLVLRVFKRSKARQRTAAAARGKHAIRSRLTASLKSPVVNFVTMAVLPTPPWPISTTLHNKNPQNELPVSENAVELGCITNDAKKATKRLTNGKDTVAWQTR